MNRWIKTLAVAGLVAMGATACNENITGLSEMDLAALRAEVALVSADGVFQDLSLLQDPGLASLGFGGAGLAGLPGSGGGNGGQCRGMGQGTHQCQGMVRDGFTIDGVVTFYDLSGGTMDAFVEGTTDKVHMVMDASGTVERAFWSASIVRHRDMTLDGLTTALHSANGSKSEEVHRSGNPKDGSTRAFDMTGSATLTNVVHAVPRSENPYPLSGTIHRQVHVTVTKDGVVRGERDVSATITFDGSQFATMTVDGESWQIDLAARRVSGRFGRNNG